MARCAAVHRLEGERLHRQRRLRAVVRAAVHARAEQNGGRRVVAVSRFPFPFLQCGQCATIRRSSYAPPGPKAKAIVEKDALWSSTSYIKEYPLVVARGSRRDGRGRGRQSLSRFHGGHRGLVHRLRAPEGGRRGEGGRRRVPAHLRIGFLLRRAWPTSASGSPRSRRARARSASSSRTPARKRSMARSSWRATPPARAGLIAFKGAFHGRIVRRHEPHEPLKVKQRAAFGPMVPEVYHVPYGYEYRCEFRRECTCDLTCVSSIERISSRGSESEGRRRDLRRADPGRRRLCRAAAGLPQGAARAVRPARHPARVRRESRAASAAPGRCSPANGRAWSRTSCSRPRDSPPACRSARSSRARVDHEVGERRARLDLRRQSGVLRRRARDARSRGERRCMQNAQKMGERLHGRLPQAHGETRRHRRRARPRAHDRRRVREGPRDARAERGDHRAARGDGLPEGAAAPRGAGRTRSVSRRRS